MIEPTEHEGFLREAPSQAGGGGDLGGHQFKSNVALELAVVREMDFAHPALGEMADAFVAIGQGGGRRGGGGDGVKSDDDFADGK